MAKVKKTDDEVLNLEIAKESNPEHFAPQTDTPPPARTKAVDPSHLEPQKEVKQEEKARPNLADPKHALPQE
jgi:hypothetical protein